MDAQRQSGDGSEKIVSNRIYGSLRDLCLGHRRKSLGLRPRESSSIVDIVPYAVDIHELDCETFYEHGASRSPKRKNASNKFTRTQIDLVGLVL
jgi:hypothetical protein